MAKTKAKPARKPITTAKTGKTADKSARRINSAQSWSTNQQAWMVEQLQ